MDGVAAMRRQKLDAGESRSTAQCSSSESRCVCGSLLARITAAGVELKCRRCKRIVVVPWASDESGTTIEPLTSSDRALRGGDRG